MRALIVILILCAGCKTAREISAEKAKKLDRIRQDEMAIFRQLKPCDTTTIYSADTLLSERIDTIMIDSVRVAFKTRIIKQKEIQKVLDQAALQLVRDSLYTSNYHNDLKDDRIIELNKELQKSELKLSNITGGRNVWRGISIALMIAMFIGAFIKLKREDRTT